MGMFLGSVSLALVFFGIVEESMALLLLGAALSVVAVTIPDSEKSQG